MLSLSHGLHSLTKHVSIAIHSRVLPSVQCQLRRYSTFPNFSAPTNEVRVEATVGMRGRVPLIIRQPPVAEPNNPIIIYLKRGIPELEEYPRAIDELVTSANATVVQLEYRLSASTLYPGPVHDVLAGYDWVKRNLTGTQHYENAVQKVPNQSKIGVCGELIGGSLAAMLALTESQMTNKHRIRATAVGNPIVDWTALFSPGEDQVSTAVLGGGVARKSGAGKPLSQTAEPYTLEHWCALRQILFRKPDDFFDPFASPLLFFRTPSFDLPLRSQNHLPRDLDGEKSSEEETPEFLPKKRRSHRAFPPPQLNLRLPTMRVDLGQENVVRDQGMEMIELMRRSVMRDQSQVADAALRANAFETPGVGLWDEEKMTEIGQWLGRVLREPL